MPTFDSQVKFQKIPVDQFVVQQSASAPSSPLVGQLWFDTTVSQLKVCTNAAAGGTWVQCDNVTGGTASNVADGDKGMITVTSGVWNIDPSVITSTMILDNTIALGDLSATGTKDTTTFLRGDNTWGVPAGVKEVRVCTTGNVPLGDPMTNNWDGRVMAGGDRMLLVGQTNPAENGVYAFGGPMVRVTDMDSAPECAGQMVMVKEGTTQGGTQWKTTFKATDTLNTTNMNWYRLLDSTGSAANVTDGDKGEINVVGGIWVVEGGVITYAKQQQVVAQRLIGNPTGVIANHTEIPLGSDLGFTGATTLNVNAYTGDVTKGVGSTTLTIANGAVSYAKMQNVGATNLVGNYTGASAAPMNVGLGTDFAWAPPIINVAAYSGGDIAKAAGAATATVNSGAITLAKLNAAVVENGVSGGTALAAQPALRKIGTAADDAMAGSTTLNQIAAPTAVVSMAGFNLTGLPDVPNSGSSATNRNYVDSLAQGLDVKPSCRYATVSNIASLSGQGTMGGAIDGGASVADGDIVLVKNQTTASQNGIYFCNGIGAWQRHPNMDVGGEFPGAITYIELGTNLGGTQWVCNVANPITVGTTPISFVQFSGAASFTDGAGLVRTGNTIDVLVDGSSIEIFSDSLRVKDLGITGAKLQVAAVDLTSNKVTNNLPVSNGGTGANASTTVGASTARGNLAAAGIYIGTSPVLTAAGTWYPMAHSLNGKARDVTFEVVSSGDQVVLDWRCTPGSLNTSVDIRTDIPGSPARAAGYYNVSVFA